MEKDRQAVELVSLSNTKVGFSSINNIKNMVVPIFVIGLISSIVTEILKLFPVLNLTKERRQAVAFVVAFVLALAYLTTQETADTTVQGVVVLITGALSASFAIYRSLVEPARKFAGQFFKKTEATPAK